MAWSLSGPPMAFMYLVTISSAVSARADTASIARPTSVSRILRILVLLEDGPIGVMNAWAEGADSGGSCRSCKRGNRLAPVTRGSIASTLDCEAPFGSLPAQVRACEFDFAVGASETAVSPCAAQRKQPG